jgi:hypothetical protein
MKIRFFIFTALLGVGNVHATQFYIDPQAGNPNNTGSLSSPWRTLQEVIANRLIQTQDKLGNTINLNAPIRAGDTLVLLSGYHGDVLIENAYNADYIKVTAAQGSSPILSSLRIEAAKKWQFSNIIVKAYENPASIVPTNYMVKMGSSNQLGTVSHVQFINSVIQTDENIENTWTATQLSLDTLGGVLIGRYAQNVVVSNNYLANISMGINIAGPTNLVTGNVITRYAQDGIRVSSSDAILQDNVILNNLKVDDNHDDAIQGYHPLGLANIVISNNIILEREPNSTLGFTGPLQGIGFFDGPLNNIAVQDNLIQISGYHGISLYDVKQSLISGNTILGFNGFKARVTLGTKSKGGVDSNKVLNNTAQLFTLALDANLNNINNRITNMNDTTTFFSEINRRIQVINQKYGVLAYGKQRLN